MEWLGLVLSNFLFNDSNYLFEFLIYLNLFEFLSDYLYIFRFDR